MSKVIVLILDKIVWMLLITILATQSLQIAGVINTPKGLGDISYPQQTEYDYQLAVVNNEARGKRQTEARSPFIDSLFNIPISTLNAVNNLVQSSRPAFARLREYAVKRFDKSSNPTETKNQTMFHKLYPIFFRSKDDSSTKKTE